MATVISAGFRVDLEFAVAAGRGVDFLLSCKVSCVILDVIFVWWILLPLLRRFVAPFFQRGGFLITL